MCRLGSASTVWGVPQPSRITVGPLRLFRSVTSSPLGSDVTRALFVALTYGVFSAVAYKFSHRFSLGVSLFPAAGVSLAGLLLSPRRMWPWIIGFVGIIEFGLNMAHHSGWGLALTFSLANTVEPVMSAFIVMAICGPTFVLQRVRHILALTFAGCVSPMVSASIGPTCASMSVHLA